MQHLSFCRFYHFKTPIYTQSKIELIDVLCDLLILYKSELIRFVALSTAISVVLLLSNNYEQKYR